MLDTKGYKHILMICDSYCFSTATMLMRTRLNLTLFVYCLSRSFCVILSPICFYTSSTRLAARSNVSVSGRPLAGAIFVCFVLVLCVKHVDFSAKGWSLVQGSPTVYVYVIECNQGNNNPPHLQWLTTGYSILTPWNRELLERLSGFQLVKKFPAFYRTRRFITA